MNSNVGRPPGQPKSGGRKKGTPNRLTQDAAEKLAALGCDPLEGMAKLGMDPQISPELRFRCYAEVAQYVYPKRKPVETTVEGTSDIVNLITNLITKKAPSNGGNDGGNEPGNGV
jgi:hypothetical protein